MQNKMVITTSILVTLGFLVSLPAIQAQEMMPEMKMKMNQMMYDVMFEDRVFQVMVMSDYDLPETIEFSQEQRSISLELKNLMMNAKQTASVDQAPGSSRPDNTEFFVPAELTITVGTTVIWTNSDSATHTITSGDVNDPDTWGKAFDSGLNKPGATFEWTFDTPGEYPYLCQLHPWMVGKIIVQAMKDMAHFEITIPNELLSGEFTATLGGKQVKLIQDDKEMETTLHENIMKSFIEENGIGDSASMVVMGTEVIPEFPIMMIVLFGAFAMSTALILVSRKRM